MNSADSIASDERPRASALEIARVLHARIARGHSGVLLVAAPGRSAEARRIGLQKGWVVALDAGPSAPVSAEAQLRYILRQRGRPEFQPDEQLSARYAVENFRPDATIRQHIEAQALGHEPLRQRIGTQRVSLVAPPHSSALHGEEQAVVRYLGEARTIPELLDQGARSGDWSPLRALRLLVLLDALGVLLLGALSGTLLEAHAVLGLDAAATTEEVKHAYRALARRLHPDSHPALDAAAYRELTDRFTALHAAYRLLLQHKSGQ